MYIHTMIHTLWYTPIGTWTLRANFKLNESSDQPGHTLSAQPLLVRPKTAKNEYYPLNISGEWFLPNMFSGGYFFDPVCLETPKPSAMLKAEY